MSPLQRSLIVLDNDEQPRHASPLRNFLERRRGSCRGCSRANDSHSMLEVRGAFWVPFLKQGGSPDYCYSSNAVCCTKRVVEAS